MNLLDCPGYADFAPEVRWPRLRSPTWRCSW